MLVGSRGYVPEPYFLTQNLRNQSRFHDPLQDSLFSNSSSVEGYREWTIASLTSGRSSGRSSPLSVTPPSQSIDVTSTLTTLLVRSSRPIRHPMTTSGEFPAMLPVWNKVSGDLYEAHLPSLVTPKSQVPNGIMTKRIRYAILEVSNMSIFEAPVFICTSVESPPGQQQHRNRWCVVIIHSTPLLPSSVFTLLLTTRSRDCPDWIRIATEIELNYNSFDAFVVLHGTDTMCYTSSALSFLLEDLGKTVVRILTPLFFSGSLITSRS